MPKQFRKEFRLKGGTFAHIRRKPNGSYEIRYRRNKMNISVASKSLDAAKERFILALQRYDVTAQRNNVTFAEFTQTWLDVVKRPHIEAKTLEGYERLLKLYVFPHLGDVPVKNIRPLDVQKILSAQLESRAGRTASMTFTIVKAIFEFAVAEDIIQKSPMQLIKKPRHETKHGSALSLEEERAFVARCLASDSPLRDSFLFLLFTGIRRSEILSAEIDAQWITVQTAKARRGEGKKLRRIPISPMLRKIMPGITKERLSRDLSALTHEFPKLCPGHHLHDLRHTFITRCQECGISRELTSLWAGHKADNTMTSNVYTHFSDEFQLKNAEKLDY